MKKRVFSFILVLTMIVSVLPNMAFAEEVVQEVAEESGTTDDGLWGYVAGEDGVVLTQYNGSATDVYVPGSIEVNGEELFVAKLGDYVFADNTGLNSATLGEGIREIGEGTFRNADNMVCVLVPEGLLTIGNEAFYGCDNFNSIILYDEIETIGIDVFAECPNVTVWCNEGTVGYTYVLEQNIPYEILNNETIPKTVVVDGNTYYVNNGCAMLMKVTQKDVIIIPSYIENMPVTMIGANAISNIHDSEIYIPETIIRIHDEVVLSSQSIYYCVENSVFQQFCKDHYYQCVILKNNVLPEIVIEDDFTYYVFDEEFAAVKSYSGSETHVTVPSEVNGIPVTKIYGKAFSDLSNVEEIVLPDTIDMLNKYSFYNCSNLMTINIPKSTEILPDYTFYGCYNLENIEMNESVRYFGSYVFGTENLIDSIVLPDTLEYLEENALTGTCITEITYPKNATIEDCAFYNNRITKVYVPDEVTELNQMAFICGNSDDLHPIYYLSETNLSAEYCESHGLMYHIIDDSGFEPYEYIENVDICDDTLGIWNTCNVEYKIFSSYAVLYRASLSAGVDYEDGTISYALTDYEVPSYIEGRPVTNIHDYAFYYNESLRNVVIADTVKYIGASAFNSCNNLSGINLNSNITTIHNSTFAACSSLTHIDLPESILTIGEYAFAYSGLEEIVFPDGLQTIGVWAFYSTQLKELVYPNCEVGYIAFGDCPELREVTVTNGVTSLTNRIFQMCSNLEFVHVPTSVTYIDKYTFNNCPRLMLLSEGYHGTYVFEFAQENGILYDNTFWYQYINASEYRQGGLKYHLTTLHYNSYGNTATVVGYDDVSGVVSIPSTISVNGISYTVRRIGSGAFRGANITSVDIPKTVTVIGDGAFQSSQLTHINLPENLDYFGTTVFNHTQISEFTFPTTYDLNLGVFAFSTSLQKVCIPEGVKLIPEHAFNGCNNIEEIVLPESVELIESYAIYNMYAKFEELVIPGNVTMEEASICGLPGLKRLILQDGITTIPRNFFSMDTLELVYLPESITSIDYGAFENCGNAIFCVYEGSYAHEFCEKKGLPFFLLGQTENPEILYGTSISGTVVYADGTVAADTTVEILYEDGTLKEKVTTDAAGTYKFTYAEVGRYTLYAVDTSGYTMTQNISVKRMNVFDVIISGDTNLVLKQGWNIYGTVSEKDANITLTNMEGDVLRVMTTDDGSFVIENIPNGTYVIVAETENGIEHQEITVFNGNITELELTIVSDTATIWGYVEVEDRECQRSRRNWLQVTIYNEEGNAVSRCKTDKEGKYEFTKLPTGEYTLVAETAEMRSDKKHGYDRSYTLTGYAYVDAIEADSYQVATIVLREENDCFTTISGKVTVNGEENICEVSLKNVFRYEVAMQSTGNNGKYAFKNVKDGLYFITATTESDGMGFVVVVVRNGRIYGKTDIQVLKSDKVKQLEDAFAQDVPECSSREETINYRERIANEKRYYDALSYKEKQQLSREYIERLNKYCEWIVNCDYKTDDGVKVEQGGLVISGNELENDDSVIFQLCVTKKEAYELSGEGVESREDYIQHSLEDASTMQHEYGILEYYEIVMTKQVGSGAEQEITSVYKNTEATGKFLVTIDIPEEYRGYKNYSFVHVHNGEVVTLIDIDEDPNTVTFEVDAFSTFALLATDEERAGKFLLGDINEDEYVNELDLAKLRCYLIGKEECDFATSDINEDAEIDARDLIRLKQGLVDGILGNVE